MSFQCPTEQLLYRNAYDGSNATSYSYNGGYGYGYGLGLDDNYNNVAWYRRIKFSEVRKPNECASLVDYINANGAAEVWSFMTTSTYSGPNRAVSRYHAGGHNTLWTDGHASWQRYGTLTLSDLQYNK